MNKLETLNKRNVGFENRENNSRHFLHPVGDSNVMVFTLFFLFRNISLKRRAGDIRSGSSKV